MGENIREEVGNAGKPREIKGCGEFAREKRSIFDSNFGNRLSRCFFMCIYGRRTEESARKH